MSHLRQIGKRVDRLAAFVPAGWGLHLEVEVAAFGVAGVADDADRLAGADGVAGVERGGSARWAYMKSKPVPRPSMTR